MSRQEDTANNYALRVTDQATVYTTGAGDTTHGNFQSVLGVPTFYTPAGVAQSLASSASATFKDSIFRITGSADVTKIAAFEVDGFTTLTTRTFTLPNYDATLATLAGVETFTNKTLTTPTIADFTNATHTHQNAAGGGTLSAAAIASGTLALARGGTNADLSATGGANQFLKQTSAGGAVTVAGITSGDLTTALTTPPIVGGVTPAAITGTTITANTSLTTPIIKPSADSTTAVTFTKADGTTAVGAIDTTNTRWRFGSGVAPTKTVDVTGTFAVTGSADVTQVTITGNATQTNNNLIVQTSAAVALFTVSGSGQSVMITSDATTNTVLNVLQLRHNSSGVIAANYGTGLLLAGQDSTTASVSMARWRTFWTTATDASRKARAVLSAFDTAERDCIFIEASGSAAMISVFSVTTPIIQVTTGVAASTFVANTSGIANDTATWDSYTIGQVVKALRNYGWLT